MDENISKALTQPQLNVSIDFADPYAPIEPLAFPGLADSGVEFFIKREDLSHPFISGNKWRKLKYHLQSAKVQNQKQLLSFGGAYSNHLLALAAAGAKYGFETTGLVRGEKVSNPVLDLCVWFGMNLIFVERSAYANNEALIATHKQENTFIIPEGGVGKTGEEGVAELFNDLQTPYDHIFCSVGTGCSMRGLLMGLEAKGWNSRIDGIACVKGADYQRELFENFPAHLWQLHTGYHFGGFAKTTPELLTFMQNFAKNTGILLDQVYEGKMAFACKELVNEGYIKSGSTVLLIHQGGTFGLTGLLKEKAVH